MTTSSIFAADIFTTYADAAKDDATRKDDNKEAIDRIQTKKLDAYAGAVLALKDVALKNGNLPKKVATEFETALVGAGLLDVAADGKVKRTGRGKVFRENVPGLIRVMRLKRIAIPTQATIDAIKGVFDELDLTSEAKITAFTKHGRDKYLSRYETTLATSCKVTFGKDERGAPRPTGLSLNGEFKDRVEAIGFDEAKAELMAAMENRLECFRKFGDMVEDDANAERDAADLLAQIFGDK